MWCLWATKGGVGVSVTAAAMGLLSARTTPTLLVDLGGDLAAVLGLDEPAETRLGAAQGVVDWLLAERPPPDALARLEVSVANNLSLLPTGTNGFEAARGAAQGIELLASVLSAQDRAVVVDIGRLDPAKQALVDRCGLSILVTRACYLGLRRMTAASSPDRVVLVREPGRALRPADVAAAVGAPLSATIDWDATVARSIDAGLLSAARLPRSLRALRALVADGHELARPAEAVVG